MRTVAFLFAWLATTNLAFAATTNAECGGTRGYAQICAADGKVMPSQSRGGDSTICGAGGIQMVTTGTSTHTRTSTAATATGTITGSVTTSATGTSTALATVTASSSNTYTFATTDTYSATYANTGYIVYFAPVATSTSISTATATGTGTGTNTGTATGTATLSGTVTVSRTVSTTASLTASATRTGTISITLQKTATGVGVAYETFAYSGSITAAGTQTSTGATSTASATATASASSLQTSTATTTYTTTDTTTAACASVTQSITITNTATATGGGMSGTLTPGRVPVATGATSLGDGIIRDDGTHVGIGQAGAESLSVNDWGHFHNGGDKLFAFGWSPSTGLATKAGKPASIRWVPGTGELSFEGDAVTRAVGDAVSITRRLLWVPTSPGSGDQWLKWGSPSTWSTPTAAQLNLLAVPSGLTCNVGESLTSYIPFTTQCVANGSGGGIGGSGSNGLLTSWSGSGTVKNATASEVDSAFGVASADGFLFDNGARVRSFRMPTPAEVGAVALTDPRMSYQQSAMLGSDHSTSGTTWVGLLSVTLSTYASSGDKITCWGSISGAVASIARMRIRISIDSGDNSSGFQQSVYASPSPVNLSGLKTIGLVTNPTTLLAYLDYSSGTAGTFSVAAASDTGHSASLMCQVAKNVP